MKTKRLTFSLTILAASLFHGCGYGRMGRPMDGYGHMMDYNGYGGMFMWLIFLVAAAVIAYLVIDRNKKTGGSTGPSQESPMEILKRRYANGEISREEFDRIKKEIEN
ncbi:putative membrane protein [Desulfatibacillum alkenivorans DSM 16219]|jgi:putative membrane protein|uniref:Putative membrane protein n=1 Tax=Desulfatibacillum alkenivorans DSM 16219 TaxID=1121393 RepID=A0A1M6UZE7_9BACT|nr:SHOCT domain-containing protein [Desulfatibacillum alkenivorans]SHK74524.1 putative membrane protein [Desulfatibacillum alkenivorans DSM 16219]